MRTDDTADIADEDEMLACLTLGVIVVGFVSVSSEKVDWMDGEADLTVSSRGEHGADEAVREDLDRARLRAWTAATGLGESLLSCGRPRPSCFTGDCALGVVDPLPVDGLGAKDP